MDDFLLVDGSGVSGKASSAERLLLSVPCQRVRRAAEAHRLPTWRKKEIEETKQNLPRSLRVVRSGMAQPPLPVTSHMNRPVPESIPGQKIVDPDALYKLKDHLRRLCHRHDLRSARAPRTGGARSRAQVSRLATRLVRLSFA